MITKYKSLSYFLNRSAVFAQYRDFLRIIKPLESNVRSDIQQQIREQYELYRHVEDEKEVSRWLRYGQEQRKHVSDLVDSAIAHQRFSKETSVNHLTWMNEEESGDHKGRIGTGWPWKKVATSKFELHGIKRK